MALEGNDVKDEISRIENEIIRVSNEVYSNLTPWQSVQLARHPGRPCTSDYIKLILTDFFELHGDAAFRDDPAIIAGIGKLDGKSIVLIGSEKGRTTKDKIYRNFGMAHPEGYRKAIRVMKFAEKFGKPIVCLIDTAGAYPGIAAEERGQAQAIAYNLKAMSTLKVPIIVAVIGEGGSGGALAIGVGDVVMMQEFTFYSVISPEGCASILWRDSKLAQEAASSLKLTPKYLLALKVIDEIIPEPTGGAHRDHKKSAETLKQAILKHLNILSSLSPEELITKRIAKFKSMGVYNE